jgi:hypothetical protein
LARLVGKIVFIRYFAHTPGQADTLSHPSVTKADIFVLSGMFVSQMATAEEHAKYGTVDRRSGAAC